MKHTIHLKKQTVKKQTVFQTSLKNEKLRHSENPSC